MIDRFERNIDYLRVSVTDRCNLRCRYCTPSEGIELLNKSRILSYEEIIRVVRVAVRVGIEKVRLTGGDPLVREGITGLVAALGRIDGLNEVTLTTNGHRLGELAPDLRKAGIERVNVSLDSLSPRVYAEITGGGDLGRVLEGIRRAREVGLGVKINVVVLRSVNECRVKDFLEFGARHGIEVRFLELMPLLGEDRYRDEFVPIDSVLSRLKKDVSLTFLGHHGVAKSYRYNGTRVGFISPMTEPFCGWCSRLRLTASGLLRPCLFSDSGVDLLPLLRSEADDQRLEEAINSAVGLKPREHPVPDEPVMMRRIGG